MNYYYKQTSTITRTRTRTRTTLLILTLTSILSLQCAFAHDPSDFLKRHRKSWARSANTQSTDWNDVVYKSSRPEEICAAVKHKVKYKKDESLKDEWKSGKITWHDGYGDCEDFSATVNSLCKEKDINARTYIFYSKTDKRGHAVTIGSNSGQMWMSSNGSYENIQSINDAKDKIARTFGWWFDDIIVEQIKQTEINIKKQNPEQFEMLKNIASQNITTEKTDSQ